MRPGPEDRVVTSEERRLLGSVANAFQQVVACSKDGWDLRPSPGVSKDATEELNGLLAILLQPFSVQEIQQRLAWILDDQGRYAKLCRRLQRVKELLGNGGSEHPFLIHLGKKGSHSKKECQAFTGNFRSGYHLRALETAKRAWDEAKAN
jgi:hypothetical protein